MQTKIKLLTSKTKGTNTITKGIACILVIALTMFITVSSSAQGTIDKINTATDKVNNGIGTVDKAKNTIDKLFGGKKKKKDEPVKTEVAVPKPAAAEKTISFEITNIEYGKLKTFEDAVKALAGVKSTSKKWSTATSTLEASFTGSADELWDLLPTQAKETFDLKGVTDGKIILEAKK